MTLIFLDYSCKHYLIDTLELALASQRANQSTAQLNDDDIDMIQAILDESNDGNEDDDAVFMEPNANNDFPRPRKD